MILNVKFLLKVILALFMVTLQIQWTGTLGGTPIRLGISDLLLPILLFMVTENSIMKQSLFKNVEQTLRWPLWFFIFTLVLIVSIVVGYHETGLISSWAIVNKFLGWCLLVGYFFLGNIIARDHYEKIEMMLKVLFISSALICIACFIAYVIYYPQFKLFASHQVLLDQNSRFTGFLGNSNSIGLFCTFVVLIQLPYVFENKILSRFMHIALMLPNIMLVIFSLSVKEMFLRSRTAKISLTVGVTYFLMIKLYKYKLLNSKRLLIIGLLALPCINFIDCKKISQKCYNLYKTYSVTDMSIRDRVETAEHAIQWWLEKPILGIGLGTFWEKQQKFPAKVMLHNTPLWILTEMGLVGLLLFLWFVVKSGKLVLRKTRECPDDILAQGILLVFPAFMLASFSMEIFYQRYLWFFMGLVLAHKASMKVAAHPCVSGGEFKQKLDILSTHTY